MLLFLKKKLYSCNLRFFLLMFGCCPGFVFCTNGDNNFYCFCFFLMVCSCSTLVVSTRNTQIIGVASVVVFACLSQIIFALSLLFHNIPFGKPEFCSFSFPVLVVVFAFHPLLCFKHLPKTTSFKAQVALLKNFSIGLLLNVFVSFGYIFCVLFGTHTHASPT